MFTTYGTRQLGRYNILNLPRTISQAAKLLGHDEDELRNE